MTHKNALLTPSVESACQNGSRWQPPRAVLEAVGVCPCTVRQVVDRLHQRKAWPLRGVRNKTWPDVADGASDGVALWLPRLSKRRCTPA